MSKRRIKLQEILKDREFLDMSFIDLFNIVRGENPTIGLFSSTYNAIKGVSFRDKATWIYESQDRPKNSPKVEKLGKVFGFECTKCGSIYIFGCGAVILKSSEINTYLKIQFQIHDNVMEEDIPAHYDETSITLLKKTLKLK